MRFYLPEVTHPHAVFIQAGFEVDFVSPKGGKAPMIGVDLQDPLNREFIENPDKLAQVENTLTPERVDPTRYSAIFYAGGHGIMWDFPGNQALSALATAIYEQGGVVGAVCHGPAGLVNIQSNGAYLVAGKTVSSFTNEEEKAVELSEVVPFLLESKLIDRGARFTKAANFQPHVVVCERLVTGQNPASASGVAERMVEEIQRSQSVPVKTALAERPVVEFGGIEPNPHFETLLQAVELVRSEGIDFLLAVGGGSVIDGTEFIAAAVNEV